MDYRIRFEGCGSTTVCARSHPDALTVARLLLSRGRRNVVICSPDGSTQLADRHMASQTA